MMGKRIDMVGQKIGRLTVVELDTEKTAQLKSAFWFCKCECGNIKSINGSKLRSGITKSCGCLRKEQAGKNTAKNLVGQTFGRLKVLKDTGERVNNRIIWLCQCECGNIHKVSTNDLTSGNTSSCGCLHKEITSSISAKDLTNQQFGLLTALYPTEKRTDNKIVWHCKCKCGNEYETNSHHLLSGHTNSCGCLKKSVGELFIKEILLKNNIDFQMEYSFPNLKSEKNYLLRYDFYLPSFNRLIEFDGEQHYFNSGNWGNCKETQQRDKIKNEYALKNNISLVRIPYWERKNITLEMLLGDKYLIKE